MSATNFFSTSSSTLDSPTGVLLYLRADGDGYMVTDTIGKRYGWGKTILHAVEMWASDVEAVCSEPRVGGDLAREQAAYRQALASIQENSHD